jgi:hypothetical protein
MHIPSLGCAVAHVQAVLLCYLLHHYQSNSSRATRLHSFRCIVERKDRLGEYGWFCPSALMFKRLCMRQKSNCHDIVLHTDPSGPQSFLDLATLGEVCRVSDGRLVWVRSADWQDTFRKELLDQHLAFRDGTPSLKFVAQPACKSSHSFPMSVCVEMELSVVTPDTCIAVDLEHRVGGLPKESKYVYLQTALLHTTLFGERRCRVSTLALRTASMAAESRRFRWGKPPSHYSRLSTTRPEIVPGSSHVIICWNVVSRSWPVIDCILRRSTLQWDSLSSQISSSFFHCLPCPYKGSFVEPPRCDG